MEEMLNAYCFAMAELHQAEEMVKQADQVLADVQNKRDRSKEELVKVMKELNCWTVAHRYMGQDYVVMLQVDRLNNSQVILRPLAYAQSITNAGQV